MDRRPKTVFQLDSPFTTSQWPTISLKDQETILELLCSLLSPIGHYKSTHVTPSKGKRSKKRKHQEEKDEVEVIPPPPELASSLLIGFNSITRHLERNAAKAKLTGSKPSLSSKQCTQGSNAQPNESKVCEIPGDLDKEDTRHVAAIFVARSAQPAVLHAHLPLLVATGSLAYPELPPTRLVQLPKNCESRLAMVLGIPRVSFVGLLDDAPHSKAIIDVIREIVMEVDAPWLKEMTEAAYLPVKINAIETFVPVVSKVKA